MGIGALNYQGVKGGLKLNDVIEEFKYAYKGQQIKAGDFVNFVNGIAGEINYGTSNGIQLNSESISGDVISVVELDENRVFVAHSYSSSYYLYGVVLTIDGTTITKGTDTQLSTSAQSGYAISAKLLPNGNVFIAYPYGSSRPLNALIATISGTTVSYGMWVQLQNTKNAGDVTSIEVLENGNVFVAYIYGDSQYLRGIVCTISGTTITKGTSTTLIGSAKAGYRISTTLLENGNVFIAHSYGSSYRLYSMVCTIDGTTITKGTDTQLSTTDYTAQHMSLALLENGNVFIAHSYTNSFHLYGMICAVSGTTITPGTDIQLNAEESVYASEECKVFSLTDNRVLIISGRNTRVGGMVCLISGKTITVLSDVQLNEQLYSTYGLDALVLSNGIIFVHYSDSSRHSYGQTFSIKNNIPTNEIVIDEYEQQVTLATQPPFDGIALSNGVGGDDTGHNEQVKIARPLYIDNLVRNGDFSNSLEGWTDLNLNTSYPISWSINNDGLKFITNSNWTGIKTGKEQIIKSQIPAGHLFYASMSIKGSFSSNHSVVLAVSNGDYASSVNVTNVSSTPSKVSLRYNSTYLYDRVQIWVRSVKSGDTATITDIKCYDLTAIFGKGNEPTQEWCDNNL